MKWYLRRMNSWNGSSNNTGYDTTVPPAYLIFIQLHFASRNFLLFYQPLEILFIQQILHYFEVCEIKIYETRVRINFMSRECWKFHHKLTGLTDKYLYLSYCFSVFSTSLKLVFITIFFITSVSYLYKLRLLYIGQGQYLARGPGSPGLPCWNFSLLKNSKKCDGKK